MLVNSTSISSIDSNSEVLEVASLAGSKEKKQTNKQQLFPWQTQEGDAHVYKGLLTLHNLIIKSFLSIPNG